MYKAAVVAVLLLIAGPNAPVAGQQSSPQSEPSPAPMQIPLFGPGMNIRMGGSIRATDKDGDSVSSGLMMTTGPVPGAAPTGGKTTLSNGWSAVADFGQPALKFDAVGNGYHLKPGNIGVVVYRAADSVSGPFQASASFTQTKASYSAHGYGLIYGGSDLDGTGQRYVYFFVRGDGKYLIKRRDGAKTTDIVSWTASSAIKTVNAQDPAVNIVEIDAKSDPKKIAFKVNGQVVHSMDATPADVKGIVGLRAGHFLDLQVDGFAVKS